jgi:hypothetical protein
VVSRNHIIVILKEDHGVNIINFGKARSASVVISSGLILHMQDESTDEIARGGRGVPSL